MMVDVIDFDQQSQYSPPGLHPPPRIPRTFYHARRSPDWPHWQAAMEDQLKKLTVANTWERVVLSKDCKAIPCKWVFAQKEG